MSQYLGSSTSERERLASRRLQRDSSLTSRELMDAWAIDPHVDPYALSLDELDPSHPQLFVRGTHWQHFKRLRDEDPVHYHESSMYGPYWSVTRYDDIRYVDSHHQLFSSSYVPGGIMINGLPVDETVGSAPLRMFIAEDPPKHDAQRKVVTPMFTPRNLAELEPLIRERAGRILDGLPIGEEFDWVRHVSVELTGQMLATLFDVPQDDRLRLIHWSDTISSLSDPDAHESPKEGMKKLGECLEYFLEIYHERRQQPPKFDLISLLAHDQSTSEMDSQEFLGNIMLLIVGGNDTTRNSISGGVLALNEYPDEYAKLKANPDLISNMVPEIIRWQSPVLHMARTATEDTQLGGKTIREGDRVCMWYISGNRDERAIPNADQFLIDRENVRQHTAFGYGIHRCVGNRLGEMQLRVLWEEITRRFSHVEVTGEPERLHSNFVHGIKTLPVRLHAK